MIPEPSGPNGPVLGVLGGMGPQASAWFMMRLAALMPAATEQDHVPAVLWSDPRIPDRPAGRAGTGPDPWPWLLRGVQGLEQAGVGAIVMPCNTAHLWYERLCAATALPFLHIVHAVVDDLARKGVNHGRIGLLGTATTLSLGLYQRELEARGYDCLLLDEAEHARYCAPPIALVKANKEDEAFAPAAQALQILRDRGADAVVLGCTELPLALPPARRTELDAVISDSIDALALSAIAWHAGARV